MTRLEAGALKVQKEMQPIEEVVGAALNRMEDRLRGRDVTTTVPADLPLVPIDSVLIEQVLINLLENATKYTPAGTAVEVGAHRKRAVRGEDDAIVVEVADRGPGIAEADRRTRLRQVLSRARAGRWRRGAGAHHLPRHRRGSRRAHLGGVARRRWRLVPFHGSLARARPPS